MTGSGASALLDRKSLHASCGAEPDNGNAAMLASRTTCSDRVGRLIEMGISGGPHAARRTGSYDPLKLPAGLPIPKDDGAAAGLEGVPMPLLALPATDGSSFPVNQPPTGSDRHVLYAYPRTPRRAPTNRGLGSDPRGPRLHS
jgi:hypothetical protein